MKKREEQINHELVALKKQAILWYVLVVIALVLLLAASCKKPDAPPQNNASEHSAEVLDKWMAMQLRLMKNTPGANHAFSRHYAYTGIAALESIAPGLHSSYSRYRNWNGLTALPSALSNVHYYYPANVNAAMAAINKLMFSGASTGDKAAIDSLEDALIREFLITQPQGRINKSADFGKQVAAAVYNWAETDGYKTANNPYTIPVGPGLWKPTPPAFANPATPYWGNNRPVVAGSLAHTQPPSPEPYSEDPKSNFYKMARQVYDYSLVLTDDQKAMATFWKDVPGATSPGHWLSITKQVVKQAHSRLDRAAVVYALTGAAINDASISCWWTKYHYNLVRPITYIREVMGFSSWNAYLGTPAHPEYSSGHSVLSAAVATMLEKLYGNIGSFTDHTYDYLGYPPRTFGSFMKIAEEAGMSRIYAGIHYMPSINAGLLQGGKVAKNILSRYGQ